MRLAYLDEAGIPNRVQQPVLVVAGPVVDGDGDWQAVERHLKSLVRLNVSEDHRQGFVFHAKDIHHGSGYFDRSRWSRDRRNGPLRELAGIPARFHLPVAVGVTDRQHIAATMGKLNPDITAKQMTAWAYAEAYLQCVRDVDRWMARETRGEVVMIVAEDTPEAKAGLKTLHLGMRQDDDAYWTEQGHEGRLHVPGRQDADAAAASPSRPSGPGIGRRNRPISRQQVRLRRVRTQVSLLSGPGCAKGAAIGSRRRPRTGVLPVRRGRMASLKVPAQEG